MWHDASCHKAQNTECFSVTMNQYILEDYVEVPYLGLLLSNNLSHPGLDKLAGVMHLLYISTRFNVYSSGPRAWHL